MTIPYTYPALIATLRILGYKDIALAIKKTAPLVPEISNAYYDNNRKYVRPDNRLMDNTPLYAQLDLIPWHKILPYIPLEHRRNFSVIYEKLGGKSND